MTQRELCEIADERELQLRDSLSTSDWWQVLESTEDNAFMASERGDAVCPMVEQRLTDMYVLMRSFDNYFRHFRAGRFSEALHHLMRIDLSSAYNNIGYDLMYNLSGLILQWRTEARILTLKK